MKTDFYFLFDNMKQRMSEEMKKEKERLEI